MNPVRVHQPCVLFALERERGPFCREFRPHEAFVGSPCWASFCGPAWLPVLVMETGVGRANVERALDWILARPRLEKLVYEPSVMVFAGFAGALTENLRVGDVMLAEEIADVEGHSWRPTWPAEWPGGEWTPPIHRGRLLTSDRMIGCPEEKRRLGLEHGAWAVDMESAVFAARCTRAGVPFACVRAISDAAGTALSPRLLALLSGGAASPWRAAATVVRHPGMLPEMLRLARDTKRAAHQLALALGELLTLTQEPRTE